MVAFSKQGNIRGAIFAGIATSTTGGNFTIALPAGRFSATPVVTATAINALVYITSKSATSISGMVLSVPALAGLSGAEVDVIAVAAG